MPRRSIDRYQIFKERELQEEKRRKCLNYLRTLKLPEGIRSGSKREIYLRDFGLEPIYHVIFVFNGKRVGRKDFLQKDLLRLIALEESKN